MKRPREGDGTESSPSVKRERLEQPSGAATEPGVPEDDADALDALMNLSGWMRPQAGARQPSPALATGAGPAAAQPEAPRDEPASEPPPLEPDPRTRIAPETTAPAQRDALSQVGAGAPASAPGAATQATTEAAAGGEAAPSWAEEISRLRGLPADADAQHYRRLFAQASRLAQTNDAAQQALATSRFKDLLSTRKIESRVRQLACCKDASSIPSQEGQARQNELRIRDVIMRALYELMTPRGRSVEALSLVLPKNPLSENELEVQGFALKNLVALGGDARSRILSALDSVPGDPAVDKVAHRDLMRAALQRILITLTPSERAENHRRFDESRRLLCTATLREDAFRLRHALHKAFLKVASELGLTRFHARAKNPAGLERLQGHDLEHAIEDRGLQLRALWAHKPEWREPDEAEALDWTTPPVIESHASKLRLELLRCARDLTHFAPPLPRPQAPQPAPAARPPSSAR